MQTMQKHNQGQNKARLWGIYTAINNRIDKNKFLIYLQRRT